MVGVPRGWVDPGLPCCLPPLQMMVNVPLFAGNPQLQEQLRLQLPVFLQQVSEAPEAGSGDRALASGLGGLLPPPIIFLCLFPTRCRTQSPSPSSPTPVPCRHCSRSSRACRPYRPRPLGWYPGEGGGGWAARSGLLPPPTHPPAPCSHHVSPRVRFPGCALQFPPLFLLDLACPSFSQRLPPTSWSLFPTALAPLGCPGPQHPWQAATPAPYPRLPPPHQYPPPRLLQQELPVLSSTSCSRWSSCWPGVGAHRYVGQRGWHWGAEQQNEDSGTGPGSASPTFKSPSAPRWPCAGCRLSQICFHSREIEVRIVTVLPAC